jgi:hypothetical protein
MTGLRTMEEIDAAFADQDRASKIISEERTKMWRNNGWTSHLFYDDDARIPPILYSSEIIHGSWWDHVSVISHSDGRNFLLAEPYEIDKHSLWALYQLVEKGLDVKVSGTLSLHFPGSTTAVVIVLGEGPCPAKSCATLGISNACSHDSQKRIMCSDW